MEKEKTFTVTYTYVKTDDGVRMLKKPVYGGCYSPEEVDELTDYILDTELSRISPSVFLTATGLERAWDSYMDEKACKLKRDNVR